MTPVTTWSLHAIVGLSAAAISLGAGGLYVRDILRGGTRPSRVTWWVLCALNLAIASSYAASGARETVWLPASYVVSFAVIGLFSIRYGEGTWTRVDLACLVGAGLGLLAWWSTRSASVALFVLILVDFVGLLPTFAKSLYRPESESTPSWAVAGAASLLNILALADWRPNVSAYAFYVLATNLVMLGCLLWPRTRPLAG